jgi:hypothetical protein
MKRILFIILLPIIFTFSVLSQGLSEHIADCFRKGNASLLRDTFARQVILTLPGTSRETDQSNTTVALERFFKDTQPEQFKVIHTSDKGETGFLVGILSTGKGSFRVHVLMRRNNNKNLIHQIRIEQINE